MAEGQGRSSGQGVKLLYIRDYLRKYTDEEHPQNAKAIKAYLASKGIKASEKTIYNDILRLQVDFDEPIAYNPKRWGYYITKPQFEMKDIRMLVDGVQMLRLITKEESRALIDKVLGLGTIYTKENLEKNIEKTKEIQRTESSIFQKVEILNKAISLNKKIRYRLIYPTLERNNGDTAEDDSDDFIIASPKKIMRFYGSYVLFTYKDEHLEAFHGHSDRIPIYIDRMTDIVILSQDCEKTIEPKKRGNPYVYPIVEREHYSFDPNREYAVTILFSKTVQESLNKRFGKDVTIIPYDEYSVMITIHTRLNVIFFSNILDYGLRAKILSPKEAIGEFFVYIKKNMKQMDELYGYDSPDFLKDVPTNYDDLRAQKHRFPFRPVFRKFKRTNHT